MPPSQEARFTARCTACGVPYLRIGAVADAAEPALVVQDLFALPLAELREVHEATLPAAFA